MTISSKSDHRDGTRPSIDPVFWLLEAAIQQPLPLELVACNSFDMREVLNRSHHQMRREAVAQKLIEMQKSGLIRFDSIDRTDGASHVVRALSVGEIMNYLIQRDSTIDYVYSLTIAGGTYFEQLSHPNWEKFVQWSWEDDSQEEIVRLSSREERTLLKFWGNYLKRPPMSYIYEFVNVGPPLEIRPWMATYWKTFEKGYEMTFKLTDMDTNELWSKGDIEGARPALVWRKYGYDLSECESLPTG